VFVKSSLNGIFGAGNGIMDGVLRALIVLLDAQMLTKAALYCFSHYLYIIGAS